MQYLKYSQKKDAISKILTKKDAISKNKVAGTTADNWLNLPK
jgi:hypothetical protein